MKRRFQELLDDAFSLFGSRSITPEEHPNRSPLIIKKFDSRARSAHPRLSSDFAEASTSNQIPPIRPRPKTSDPRRIHTFDTPKCAWGSGAPSPLVRPLSAGSFHKPTLAPHICPVQILPEGRLSSHHPAVPIIKSIKDELKQCERSARIRRH